MEIGLCAICREVVVVPSLFINMFSCVFAVVFGVILTVFWEALFKLERLWNELSWLCFSQSTKYLANVERMEQAAV